MYNLNEKKFVVKKLIKKLTAKNIKNIKNEQKINKKLFVEKFNA